MPQTAGLEMGGSYTGAPQLPPGHQTAKREVADIRPVKTGVDPAEDMPAISFVCMVWKPARIRPGRKDGKPDKNTQNSEQIFTAPLQDPGPDEIKLLLHTDAPGMTQKGIAGFYEQKGDIGQEEEIIKGRPAEISGRRIIYLPKAKQSGIGDEELTDPDDKII
jgi:hypothetical protein